MNIKKNFVSGLLMLGAVVTLGACGTQSQTTKATEETVDFNTLTCTGSMELKYATQFSVEEYGDYSMITIVDDGRFLLIPEGKEVPTNVPLDVTVLKQPIENAYLVSTSVMDLVCTIDALDNVRLSGTKCDEWYIPEAMSAMESGDILYAGKYSEPDYELIISEGCDLAIENTMISHNPEAKEKLEELNIPVIVEHSSYESHPLGRLEWIKLYGLLFDREEEATSFYDGELTEVEPIMEKDSNEKSVAFFYVTASGAVNVRKPNDYISQMIELAGGKYALSDVIVEEENALSTMNMQMEDFYANAKDADVLIYNSTIEGELYSVDELIGINPLFEDFKAVKEGNVYCTTSNFFQETTGTAKFIEDINNACLEVEGVSFYYLKPLE